MLKKLLSLTIGSMLLISTTVSAGERMAKDENVYNPNNYRVEDSENGLPLLIPDYFKQVYKDTNEPLENYIPMYFKGELFPVCIERIYRYYYYDDNGNKKYTGYGEDLNIYNINGNDYISIR